VPSYNLATVGRRAFPVSVANLWNSLPAHLTSAPSLTVFRQRLEKTFLLRRYYHDLIWHSEFTFCCGPISNYVITGAACVSFTTASLTIWRHVGTVVKCAVPDRVKRPSFVIFDIRALWRSGLSVRVPGCQKLQKWRLNPVWHSMFYSCTLWQQWASKG